MIEDSGDAMFKEVVFVFGSNIAGRHGKGAAKHAKDCWGAEYGVGEGPTGRAYALPTKDARLRVLTLPEIERGIVVFMKYARTNPSTLFLLTPVGCGLASKSKRSLWTIINELKPPANVALTASWMSEGSEFR